jgi:hypothetical protein
MPKESRDQKRKKKLEERKQKARPFESLAYHGDKYKTDALAPIWLQTETGIYQAFVMTDRMLYDHAVIAGLRTLIVTPRSGPFVPSEHPDEIHHEDGRDESLVAQTILRNWTHYFAEHDRPPKDDLLGVLRTVLGMAETKKEPGPRSRTYLLFIENFIARKVGVTVTNVPAESGVNDG